MRAELKRRRNAVALVMGLVLVAAACASDPGGDEDGRSHGPKQAKPVGKVLDLSEAGYHEIPGAPIERRSRSAQVWTGRELVVWGGQLERDGSTPGRIFADGATLSLEDGRWTPMAPSPFPDGLYTPSAAWDGTEVIIIGTQCDGDIPNMSVGGSLQCPGGPAAAAWNPDDRTWRRLADPPVPVDNAYGGEAIIATQADAAGAAGSAVFTFGYQTTAISWDRATGTWTIVDDPWTDGTTISTCADPVEERLIAVEEIGRYGGPSTPDRVWTIEPGETTWSEAAGSPLTVAAGGSFSCGDGMLVHGANTAGHSEGTIFNPETGNATPAYEAAEGLESRSLRAIGTWIYSSGINLPTGSKEINQFQEVRRVDDDMWHALTPSNPPSDGTGGPWPAIYVDVGTVSNGEDDPIVFWRAPAELQN